MNSAIGHLEFSRQLPPHPASMFDVDPSGGGELTI